jgi:hypothetical protein
VTRVPPRDSSTPHDPLRPRDSSEHRGSRRIGLTPLRQALFQLHGFIGITAGTLLMLIGLSGVTLSFREEILNAMNPGSRYVPLQAVEPLQPQQVLNAVRQSFDDRPVATVTLFSNTSQATRINFAPREGERRGETVYLDPAVRDPIDAALGPSLRSAERAGNLRKIPGRHLSVAHGNVPRPAGPNRDDTGRPDAAGVRCYRLDDVPAAATAESAKAAAKAAGR